MDSRKLSGKDLQQRLYFLTKDLGEPIIDPEVEKRLQQIWSSSSYNTFYLLVDVRGPSLLRTHRLLPVLGYSKLDMDTYINLIHPDYRQLHMEFGASAYQIAYELAAHLQALGQTYSIQYPIKTAEKGYWWVNQISEAAYFDDKGQMVVHLNTYQLFRPYHREGPTKPLLLFPNLNLTHDFVDVIGNLLTPWLAKFTPAEKQLVETYWRMCQEDKNYTNEEIASLLGWTHYQVTNRNKSIKRKAEEAFPISEFKQAKDVGVTLYRLFGNIGKLEL
jgi:hypothetical protein